MPGGFGEIDYNREKEKEIIHPEDVEYIEVTCIWHTNGTIEPVSFIFEGQRIKIDKVIDMVSAKSLKHQLSGTRYKCKAMNKMFYLFFDGKGWYIEI